VASLVRTIAESGESAKRTATPAAAPTFWLAACLLARKAE
jgi:hypothetical protein